MNNLKLNDNNPNTMKVFYSVVISFLPILMFFNVPIINTGLSTFLVAILSPYAIVTIFRCQIKKIGIESLFFFIFAAYIVLRSFNNFSFLILFTLCFIHILGFFHGSIDLSVTRKTIEITSCMLTVIIILQFLFYYIFGVRFTPLFKELVVTEKQYMIESFLLGKDGLFRPSAFFLEPAHYAQFATIGLASALFNNNKPNIKKVAFICLGIVLTGSGIGLIMILALLFFYILFNKHFKGIKKIILVVVSLGLSIAIFAFLLRFSFFQEAVARIIGDYSYGNAIWGRTARFEDIIKPMQGIEAMFGNGSGARPDNVFFTGFMEIIYCYGYIGLIVLLLFLLCLLLKQNTIFGVCAIFVFIGLLFSSDIFSFIFLCFYFSFFASSIGIIKTENSTTNCCKRKLRIIKAY